MTLTLHQLFLLPLFLTPVTFAFFSSSPSLPPLPYRRVDNLRSTAHVLRSCIPSTRTNHGLSAPLQCPCTAQLSLHTHDLTSLPSVSLHIVPYSNPHHTLHILHVNASSPHTNTVHIPHSERLAVVLHTTGNLTNRTDCATQVRFSFNTLRQVCPVALPLELGVPSRRNDSTSVTPRIFGGHSPPGRLRTHMAAFISAENNFVCSGSVIGRRYVLTAAHCPIETNFTVRIGGESIGSGRRLGVLSIVRHPSYLPLRQDSPNDIALVTLTDDVPEGTVFLKVSTNDTIPVDNSYVRASGYGRTMNSPGGELRQVDVPIVAMDDCKRYYRQEDPTPELLLDEDLQLCAGLRQGGCDACQGDSGGPLIVFDQEGEIVQVGIVSFGIRCAEPQLPGVYTKLSPFAGWLRENGAEFVETRNAVAVFTAENFPDVAEGFQLFGLPEIPSIVVLCGFIVLVFATVLIAGVALRGLIKRKNTNEEEDTEDVEGSDQGDVGANVGYNFSGNGYEGHEAGLTGGGLTGGEQNPMQFSGYDRSETVRHDTIVYDVSGVGGPVVVPDVRYGARDT